MRMNIVREANCFKDSVLGISIIYWFQVMRRKQKENYQRADLSRKSREYHVQKIKLNKSFKRNGWFRVANAADKSNNNEDLNTTTVGMCIVVEGKPDFSSLRENGRREIRWSINFSILQEMNEVVEVKRKVESRDVFIYFSREKSQKCDSEGEESNGGQSDAPEVGKWHKWHTSFFYKQDSSSKLMEITRVNCLQWMQKNRCMC